MKSVIIDGNCLRDEFARIMKEDGIKAKGAQVEWLMTQLEAAHHLLEKARQFEAAGGDLIVTAIPSYHPENPDLMRLEWAVYHPCDNSFLTRFGNKFLPREGDDPGEKFWSKVSFQTPYDAIMAAETARAFIVHGAE